MMFVCWHHWLQVSLETDPLTTAFNLAPKVLEPAAAAEQQASTMSERGCGPSALLSMLLVSVHVPAMARHACCSSLEQHRAKGAAGCMTRAHWLHRGAAEAEELEQWGAPAGLLASRVVREVVCVNHLYTPRLADA